MSGPELRTPEEWERRYGLKVTDPDGWRLGGAGLGPAKDWDEPVSRTEWEARMSASTVDHRPPITYTDASVDRGNERAVTAWVCGGPRGCSALIHPDDAEAHTAWHDQLTHLFGRLP